MCRARDVQPPVPRTTDLQRLRVQRVIPTAADEFDPALHVAREVEVPSPPRPFVFPRHVGWWDGVPAEPAVSGKLDSLGPSAAARVRPPLDVDLAHVHDDLLCPGRHDCGAHWHLLDLDAVGELLVVFADLLVEVEVLPALHRRPGGFVQGANTVEPLSAPGADVAGDDDSDGIPVYAR